MAQGHEDALALVRDSKTSVHDPKIKAHLQEVEPVLEKHRAMAQSGGHEHGDKTKSSTKQY